MARKILLADDSVTAQNMGRKILVDAGYEILTVNNGSAALKRITESKPDLIVLDVYMPGYSGLEVCQRLKDSPETAHIPVLLTVGKLEPFKPQEARRVRADAHIVKPFEASELLSAIARLEDLMVPNADAPRFGTTVSGVERFGRDESSANAATNADPDTGWKSRLRFPSKGKKEEPEGEPADVVANFRDFRKVTAKPAAAGAFVVSAAPTEAVSPPAEKVVPESATAPVSAERSGVNQGYAQEPGLVPDIPRDITPEELDALSAVAAKLDEKIPQAETTSGATAKATPAEESPQVSTQEIEANPGPRSAVAPVSAKTEEAVVAPPAEVRTAGIAKEVEVPVLPVAAAESARNEVEIPVQRIEPVTEMRAAELTAEIESPSVESQRAEPQPIESRRAESQPTPEASAANNALFANEPAPIDRQDEPIFASAAADEKAAEKIEAQAAEVEVASVQTPTEAPTAIAAKAEEPKPEETKTKHAKTKHAKIEEVKIEEAKIEEVKTEKSEKEEAQELETTAEESSAVQPAPPVPVAAESEETVESDAPAPSEDELAEALRLLTPAPGHAEASIPSQETLVAAGQLLAEATAHLASHGPHWVAEPVALTAEEAALSLEEEMFRTFAAAPATAPTEEVELPSVVNRESAIQSAI